MPHDIFVSYSRRDLAAVKTIKEKFESLGFSCWMDLQGIESGSEEFTDKIAAAIVGSNTTLFFLSNGSQESRWSLNELRVARDEGKHVVLVRFNDDRMKIKFKLEFGGSDIIDWRKPEQAAKLLRDLARWTGSGPARSSAARSGPASAETPSRAGEHRSVRPLLALAVIAFLVAGSLGALLLPQGREGIGGAERAEAGSSSEPQIQENGAAGRSGDARAAGDRSVVTVAGVSVPMRWCPPGTFTMGSENGDSNERPALRVTVPNGFWMGETEVKQELWQKVMGDNPSRNRKGGSYPVENVSWNDCMQFVKKLNERMDVKSAGVWFTLPTEAQWEYACRAGKTGDYGGTCHLDEMGWYDRNSGLSTHPVQGKQPNAWGIHDMHGNVSEWCANAWMGRPDENLDNDAAVRTLDDSRVLRGGGCWSDARSCRSAKRGWNDTTTRSGDYGLRLLAFPDGK